MHNIMLVDNHPIAAEMMRILLEYSGRFQVTHTFDSSYAALAHAYTEKPDLLITDTPGLDGTELVMSLRKHGYKLPIVVVSAGDTRRTAISAWSAGASGFVHKSVLFKELTIAASLAVEGRTYFPDEVMSMMRPVREAAVLSSRDEWACIAAP